MNLLGLFDSVRQRSRLISSSVVQLPLQARCIVYVVGSTTLIVTLFVLGQLLGWWLGSLYDINTTKPRISRFLGYLEAAPEIESTLSKVQDALSQVAIEDTGDTGRGGALLQQQLRQLAADAGLTVTGSEVKEPENLGTLVKLKTTLQVTGGPANFDEFISLLYDGSPILFPTSIKLEALRRINRRRQPASVSGMEDHVSAVIDVAAFRLRGSES